jgi:hypothetical protein
MLTDGVWKKMKITVFVFLPLFDFFVKPINKPFLRIKKGLGSYKKRRVGNYGKVRSGKSLFASTLTRIALLGAHSWLI